MGCYPYSMVGMANQSPTRALLSIPRQRFNGVKLRRLPRRQIAENDAGQKSTGKGNDDRRNGENHLPAGYGGGRQPAADARDRCPGARQSMIVHGKNTLDVILADNSVILELV